MKTFEERYTAWIDGILTGAELEAFEKELEDHPDAFADREDAVKLGDMLRTHGQSPALSNGEFFNHQLLSRIREEEKAAVPSEQTVPVPALAWLLRPFAWAVAALIIVAGISVYKVVAPQPVKPGLDTYVDLGPTPVPIEPEKPYNAEIVSAESTDPDISVTPIHSDKDKVTVLWVDGLDYLPASYHGE